jgi:predicted aspartyl protease
MPLRTHARVARPLGVLIAGVALCAQALPELPPTQATGVVQADRDRHQRMTVPVTINGAGPYRFLVDTGAQATVVTARVTEELGLVPSGRATLVAMASRTSVETITLDGLEFAGRRFNNLTAPLLRGSDIGADGIIGLDSLQELRVVIDFRADAITVVDAPAGNRAGYEIVVRARRKLGQMIITDARIGGVRTAVIIDTGSWYSLGNRALQRKLRTKNADRITYTDVAGGTLHSDSGTLAQLQIGSLGLANLPVGFTDSPAFAALGLADKPALILGIGNLRPFDRIAIDFASRRILFDVPKGAGGTRLDALFAGLRVGG